MRSASPSDEAGLRPQGPAGNQGTATLFDGGEGRDARVAPALGKAKHVPLKVVPGDVQPDREGKSADQGIPQHTLGYGLLCIAAGRLSVGAAGGREIPLGKAEYIVAFLKGTSARITACS